MFKIDIDYKRLSEILGYNVEKYFLQQIDLSGRTDLIGDKALGLAVTILLTEHFPKDTVGTLTVKTSRAVSNNTLYYIAKRLGLERFVIRHGTKHMADAVEAIIGRIYLDCERDIEIIEWFIIVHWPFKIFQLEEKIIHSKFFALVKALNAVDEYEQDFLYSLMYKKLRLALKSPYILGSNVGMVMRELCSDGYGYIENIALLEVLLLSRAIPDTFLNECLKSCILRCWKEGVYLLLSHVADINAVVKYYPEKHDYCEVDDITSDPLEGLDMFLHALSSVERVEGKVVYELDYSEISFFHLAVSHFNDNDIEVLEGFLKRGADPNWSNGLRVLQENPFGLRTYIGINEMMSRRQPLKYKRVSEPSTALHYAYSDKEKVRLLLKYRANPNCQDEYGDTPLHYVCRREEFNRDVEIINMLIEGGANIYARNGKGITPIDLLTKYKYVYFYEEFIELLELVKGMHQRFYHRNSGKYPIASLLKSEYSLWKSWSYQERIESQSRISCEPT